MYVCLCVCVFVCLCVCVFVCLCVCAYSEAKESLLQANDREQFLHTAGGVHSETERVYIYMLWQSVHTIHVLNIQTCTCTCTCTCFILS